MLKMRRFKLLNSMMLVLVLIMGVVAPSFASSDDVIINSDLNIKYKVIDNNSVIITEESKKSLITQKEYESQTITTIKDLETGNEEYFLRDEEKGTIYSSITDSTIKLDDSKNNSVDILRARDEDRLIASHSVSYATLEYLVGSAGTATAMATAALAYKGMPLGAGIALIATFILGFGDMTAGAFALRYPNGGIVYEQWRVTKYFQGLPEYRTVIRNVGHRSRL